MNPAGKKTPSNAQKQSYVRKQITDALFTLLQNQDLSSISILDLSEQAMVARASFYRNYENKEAVITDWIHEDLDDWAKKWDQGADGVKQLQELFERLYANKDRYLLLYRRNLLSKLKDYFTQIFHLSPDLDLVSAYAIGYVIYMLYGWIEIWMMRGMKESPEQIAALAAHAARQSPNQSELLGEIQAAEPVTEDRNPG